MTTLRFFVAGCACLLFASCSKTEANGTKAASPPAASPELNAILAKADAKDGKTDKVVHKCAGCGLGMDGKPEFTLQVSDYTLHFCKQGCLDTFKPDPQKAVLAMKIKD